MSQDELRSPIATLTSALGSDAVRAKAVDDHKKTVLISAARSNPSARH